MSYTPPPYWILTEAFITIDQPRGQDGVSWYRWISTRYGSCINGPPLRMLHGNKMQRKEQKQSQAHININKDCHITHPPGRNTVTGQLPSMVLGRARMQLTVVGKRQGLAWVIKHMHMADPFKETQFCVLRKLCWRQGDGKSQGCSCAEGLRWGDLLRRPNTHLARTLIFQKVAIILRDKPTNTTPYTDDQLKLKPALMCSREAGSLEFCSSFLI